MIREDYCRGPTCGWLKRVNEAGLCEDCEHLQVDTGSMIQKAFGPNLVDRTEQTRTLWQTLWQARQQENEKSKQIVGGLVAKERSTQYRRLRTRIIYWLIYPVMLLIGIFYILFWLRVLL